MTFFALVYLLLIGTLRECRRAQHLRGGSDVKASEIFGRGLGAAVCLLMEHAWEYPSPWAAITSLMGKIACRNRWDSFRRRSVSSTLLSLRLHP